MCAASKHPMTIAEATRAYEVWLGGQVGLIPQDLQLKHQRMAESPLAFLRATFYRWAQLWHWACPDLAAGPAVLGVGDLHLENFGTWRDSEGRLVWGVNDFDEACHLAYANDLVRLAVSVQLAAREQGLSSGPALTCRLILAGYTEAMEQGGKPFVLAERHRWLRELAISDARDPARFWDKLSTLPTVSKAVPRAVTTALKRALPEPSLSFRVVHRQAGLGSLGRRRFAALAEWRGGFIAREAKELAPSAWRWESPGAVDGKLLYPEIIGHAVRVADPFVSLQGPWLLRRLAPDCSRIELGSLTQVRNQIRMLHAMGRETANVHLGNREKARAVLQDLKRRPDNWLRKASATMLKLTLVDWNEWRAR